MTSFLLGKPQRWLWTKSPYHPDLLSVSLSFFHSTVKIGQSPNHPLYSIIEWKKVDGGRVAVVDPLDPSTIVYYSSREYNKMSAVMISNDESLIVLAKPGDSPISPMSVATNPLLTDPSKKLPPKYRTNAIERQRVAALLHDHLIPSDLQPDDVRSWRGMATRWRSWFSRYTTPVQSGSIRKLLLPHEGNLKQILRYWGSVLASLQGDHLTNGFRSDILSFSIHCYAVLRDHDLHTLCLRMKVYLFACNSYLGGSPLKSTEKLGIAVKLTHGLPTALPLGARHAFRIGNVRRIRQWVSMLGSFRAFQDPPSSLNYGTITSPPAHIERKSYLDFNYFVCKYWVNFTNTNPLLCRPQVSVDSLAFITTSGVNGSPALLHAETDAKSWFKNGKLLNLFQYWKAVGVSPIVLQTFFASLGGSWYPYFSFLDRPNPGEGTEHLDRGWHAVSDDTDNKSKWWKMRAFYEATYNQQLGAIPAAVYGLSEEDGPNHVNLRDPKFYSKSGVGHHARLRAAKFLWNNLNDDGSMSSEVREWYTKLCDPQESPLASATCQSEKSLSHPYCLGRLSFKYGEPAGKTRFFAIPDYWTQVSFRPLHDYLFKVLAALPADSTFDQSDAVRRLATCGPVFHSFDLKAATDLMPLKLHELVLSYFIGADQSRTWSKLLVDRDFILRMGSMPQNLRPMVRQCTDQQYVVTSEEPNCTAAVLRYTRGQPMGALSSWAMLALTHHLLIQYSAWRAGANSDFKFSNYAVLGDDNVIASEPVAKMFPIVCRELGVPLNLVKTFQSTQGFFHFAERAVKNGVDLSPISLREECNVTSIHERAIAVDRILERDWFQVQTAGNLLQSVVSRMVRPNIARVLRTEIWTQGVVDTATKCVAPLILQPQSPLRKRFATDGSIIWEWLQSLSQKLVETKTSLFYRGTTRGDFAAAPWSVTDLKTLYTMIIDPLFQHCATQLTTRYDRLDKLTSLVKLNGKIHPTLWMLWLNSILPSVNESTGECDASLAIYRRRLSSERKAIALLSPGTRVSEPVFTKHLKNALGYLQSLLELSDKLTPPAYLETEKPIKKAQRRDEFTYERFTFWKDLDSVWVPGISKKGPPRSTAGTE